MAGHSKWATTKHKKAANDAKRGKEFAKLIKNIEVAARTGGGDPTANPTLDDMIRKAKKASVPNDNIERARKRGSGEEAGEIHGLIDAALDAVMSIVPNAVREPNGAVRLAGLHQQAAATLLSYLVTHGIEVYEFSRAHQTLEDVFLDLTGEGNVAMTVELIHPIAIEEGTKFSIREGGRTVGTGVVSKVLA